jgi:hypothetical protein
VQILLRIRHSQTAKTTSDKTMAPRKRPEKDPFVECVALKHVSSLWRRRETGTSF